MCGIVGAIAPRNVVPILLDEIWGNNVYVEERTVDVHIRRLRQALEPTGHKGLLETVRGVGYCFRRELPAEEAKPIARDKAPVMESALGGIFRGPSMGDYLPAAA